MGQSSVKISPLPGQISVALNTQLPHHAVGHDRRGCGKV